MLYPVKLKGRTNRQSGFTGEDNLLCNFVKNRIHSDTWQYTILPFHESKRLDVDYLYKLAESFWKSNGINEKQFFTTDYVYLTAKMLLAISRIFSKK